MNSPNPNISINTSSIQLVASNDDLLLQILIRLPSKSISRFKSVSKHWKSLICTPQFRLMHSLVPDFFKGLVFKKYKSAYVVDFNIPLFKPFRELKLSSETNWDMDILSSCRGLLLCSGNLSGYYICNPTTNDYSEIPAYVNEGGFVKAMCLAFDPSKSPHYRVVCVTIMRKCGDGGFVINRVDFSDGVYCNGAIHWISKFESGESIYFNPDDDYDEMVLPYKVMPTPPMGHRRSCYVGESGDYLHCMNLDSMFSYFGYTPFNVYEMRGDYSGWFMKYKVYFQKADIRKCSFDSVSLFGLVWGKEDEDSFLVMAIEKRIVRYNLVSKTFVTMYDFDGVENCCFYLHCNTYSPSFLFSFA
ncbi:hypothetical protein CASFOL_006820 [Castilleja foliolosa]|uniref:F-box domain-containing protein n=1 Tax=Castilleja foliolosa TaxID=1961234 RepID=A0ABD3E8B6_9LAMI